MQRRRDCSTLYAALCQCDRETVQLDFLKKIGARVNFCAMYHVVYTCQITKVEWVTAAGTLLLRHYVGRLPSTCRFAHIPPASVVAAQDAFLAFQ
jgi:hypothetical protein